MRPSPTAEVARRERDLRRLELVVTRKLDGLLHGDYQGLVPGAGSEPGEGRPYSPGDDVRRIDWNLTARTTTVHVRDSVADRELETWVVVDGSPSLDFGTANREKRDLALAAVAAVGFSTARMGNRMGALVARPGRVERIPARSGNPAIYALLQRLASADRPEPGGPGTDMTGALAGAAKTLPRRGMVVVVSDFILPPGWERPLRQLARRHEVLAVEVVDPRELELPNVGLLSLVDPESGRLVEVQTAKAKVRARYAEAAADRRRALAVSLRGSGASHLVLRTDRDWVLDLARHLAGRRRARSGFASPRGAAPGARP